MSSSDRTKSELKSLEHSAFSQHSQNDGSLYQVASHVPRNPERSRKSFWGMLQILSVLGLLGGAGYYLYHNWLTPYLEQVKVEQDIYKLKQHLHEMGRFNVPSGLRPATGMKTVSAGKGMEYVTLTRDGQPGDGMHERNSVTIIKFHGTELESFNFRKSVLPKKGAIGFKNMKRKKVTFKSPRAIYKGIKITANVGSKQKFVFYEIALGKSLFAYGNGIEGEFPRKDFMKLIKSYQGP